MTQDLYETATISRVFTVSTIYRITFVNSVIYLNDLNARYIDIFNEYPIIYFSYYLRNIEILKSLIYYGASLLVTRDAGENILHLSSMNNDIEIVRILLKASTDLVNIRDNDGVTPLMYAALGGGIEVVIALLGAGANPHNIDNQGNNALDYATQAISEEVVELLSPYAEFLFPNLDFFVGCNI